jgi:adenine-specific DNA-methyltransferase
MEKSHDDKQHQSNDFLKQQLITYMGNKRKLLTHIDDIITHVQNQLGGRTISFADPFSGSGVVSRLALASGRVHHLLTNDLALYAHTCNLCYLRTPTNHTRTLIHALIDTANALPDPTSTEDLWIARFWAPADDTHIIEGERCYFTRENALRIDAIRNFIASDAVPENLKPYLLAPLLVQASIHNNTNGQFAAFYKDAEGIGAFGGKKATDVKRITQRIALPYPCWLDENTTLDSQSEPECVLELSQKDALQWTRDVSTTVVDLLYLDPPYNKHPYAIYYFLLDIIAHWDKTIEIPDSYRGQPKTWIKSPFNSSIGAANALRTMIADTPARFVALSYYDAGILSVEEIDALLAEYGSVERHPIQHNVYKRLHGLGAYKRSEQQSKQASMGSEVGGATCIREDSADTSSTGAKEYMWLLRKVPK